MCTHVCMKYFPCPLYLLVLYLKESATIEPVFYQPKTVLHAPFEVEAKHNGQVRSKTMVSIMMFS